MTRFAGLIMGGLQELTNGWIRPTDKWLNQKNLRLARLEQMSYDRTGKSDELLEQKN